MGAAARKETVYHCIGLCVLISPNHIDISVQWMGTLYVISMSLELMSDSVARWFG